MIKAVVFDFDDTLVKTTDFVNKHLIRVIERYPKKQQLKTDERKIWEEKIRKLTDKNIGFTEIFDTLFDKEEAENFLADYRKDAQEYNYEPIEGALEFVEDFKKRNAKLYILSNRTNILPFRATQAGFNPYDFEIYSAPEGHSKPDPISYSPILEQIENEGLKNEEVLFIGNHIDDYKGLPDEWRKRFRAIPDNKDQKTDFIQADFPQKYLFDNYSELRETINSEFNNEINNIN